MRPRLLIESILIVAGLCIIGSFAGVTSCYFTGNQTSGLNAITAWASDAWSETTTADFNAGLPSNVDTTNNEVKLTRASGSVPSIYALGGGGTLTFSRYTVSTDTWAAMAGTLAPVYAGGALASDGGDALYAFAGNNGRNFTRYTISTNSWAPRADTLASVNAGGALTYAGGNIYALAGGGTTTFLRYSPGTNTWTAMTNAPAAIAGGGSLASPGGNYLYACAGGDTATFLRYDISANTWTTLTGVPDRVGDGGAMTSGGAGSLYVGTGKGKSKAFYQYAIATGAWTARADTPEPVAAGGALTADGGTSVYGFRGGNSPVFWRYAVVGNSWISRADAPAGGWGASLAYAPGTGSSSYASPGSVASVVFDTASPDSRWDLLAWNASIPAGTAIAFEARASNTPFPGDAGTPGWTSVSGSLVGGRYVAAFPNLPSGRYQQWRATLSSTVGSSTPALYDVTAYYSGRGSAGLGSGSFVFVAAEIRSAGAIGSGAADRVPGLFPPSAVPAPETTVPTAPPAATTATLPPTPPATTAAPVQTATAAPAATGTVTETATPTPDVTAVPVETRAANATPTSMPPAAVELPAQTPTATVAETAPTIPAPNVTAVPAVTEVPTAGATPAVIRTVPAASMPNDTATATVTPAPRTLLEIASADRNLTTFVGLARRAGLDRGLEGPVPHTVFAPTDDAFRALPPAYLARLGADPALLARLLDRHVAEGGFAAAELAGMPTVRTLDGADVNVTVQDGVLTIEGVSVNYTGGRAGNGVIHAIDGVLLPADAPSPTASPPMAAATAAPSVAADTTTTEATVALRPSGSRAPHRNSRPPDSPASTLLVPRR